MNKFNKKNLYISITLLFVFVLWTVFVIFFDVQNIGPQFSSVGFASLNSYFHNFTGVNMNLYIVTDWLSLVPFLFIFGFAILGLIQLVRRKSLFKVDNDILLLGLFYILIIIVFIFFEIFVVHYRPILINDSLEASYPSSTTMLVIAVMTTANIQLRLRIKKPFIKNFLTFLITTFTIFIVAARLISGVHWLTDIIGGTLISFSLVFIYKYLINKIKGPNI